MPKRNIKPTKIHYQLGDEKVCVGEFHYGSASNKKVLSPGKGIKLFLTDPPYNLGFDYGEVSDNQPEEEYHQMMEDVFDSCYEAADDNAHLFIIHYPQDLAKMWHRLTKKWKFHQWINWNYPANFGHSTKKWTNASRTILWLVKGEPNFYGDRVVQPYRNPTDRRIKKLIHEEGKIGTHLYNWWQVNLCKNVSRDKKEYSNQIPEALLERIILSTTDLGDIVADPFSGTFSTSRTAMRLGRKAWGCDLNPEVVKWRPTIDEYNHEPEIPEQQYDREYPFYKLQEAGMTESQFEKVAVHLVETATPEQLARAPGIGLRKAKEFVANLRGSRKDRTNLFNFGKKLTDEAAKKETNDLYNANEEIDWSKVNDELELKQPKGLTKQSREKRQAMLQDVRTWPRGDLENYCSVVPSVVKGKNKQIYTPVYSCDDLEIGVLAPGKEASNNSTTKSYVGDRGLKPNHNDMLPVITKDGKRIDDVDLTFGQMFDLLGRCAKSSEDGLLILGAMLYRNGFCLDHSIVNGEVRLNIPKYSLSVLKSELSHLGDFPIESFIYFIDLIAANEDAKVHALGREKFERYGRPNTLLTFTHVISVLLGKVTLAKLCGSYSRPPSGMAAITDTDAREMIFAEIYTKSS